MSSSGPKRTQVFISYSHKDAKYVDQLLEHLVYYERNGLIDCWSDKRISAGAEWRKAIKQAIASTKVAILLISPSFLASQFIAENELPPLLAAAEEEGIIILSVIVRPTNFEDTELIKFQTVNNLSQPLTKMKGYQKDELWAKVVRDIKKAIALRQSGELFSTADLIQGDLRIQDTQKIVPHVEQRRQVILNHPGHNSLPPLEEVKWRYLKRVVRETEILSLKGIPAGLISEGVRLDEVFISLQLRPNRPKSEYPLTERELEIYRDGLKNETLSNEMEQMLLEVEQDWVYSLNKNENISIPDFWLQLTRDQPIAVIQGFPGMGKSTLLARLALHMALESLEQPDVVMQERLKPPLIPILLSLGDYALEREREGLPISLSNYIVRVLDRLNIPEISLLIQRYTQVGGCLFLFDGLDEVSEVHLREEVQHELTTFIQENRDTFDEIDCWNRFLITSRVAGYDQYAFPYARHYTIAELTAEQIHEFLLCWSRADIRHVYHPSNYGQDDFEEAIETEAMHMANAYSSAIQQHKGVLDLAENPLLLTLLAVIQRNSTELPRRRVELYDVVTHTLLENRNIAKRLLPIPEAQAIQRLGPVAYEMQKNGSSFIREREVLDVLTQTIRPAGGTTEEILQEANTFLKRIRERSGLFVKRTGDYFGFFHRTFQEYFAARHLLNKVERDRLHGITKLVNKSRRLDDLWRESFLLATAYKGGENSTIASEIISTLLNVEQNASTESIEHDLFLAAECVIEARPLTIDPSVERRIALLLLHAYEKAQHDQRFEICNHIEGIMRRWLISLPDEIYRLPLLTALKEHICDYSQLALQRATLILLSMIVDQLHQCPRIVFTTLIPSLLALAGLPAVSLSQPTDNIPISSDLDIADLALLVLSRINNKQGPASLLLTTVRQHFEKYPNHLQLLAQHSLECHNLLSCVSVPLDKENYRRYELIFRQWLTLLDHLGSHDITIQDINRCLIIHQDLLSCAEEIRFPSTLHFLNMLLAESASSDKPWRHIWQEYLYEQLGSGNYIQYQEVALLWLTLFPEEHDVSKLADLLLEHYSSDGKRVQSYARRFLSTFSNDIQVFLKPQEYIKHRDLRKMRGLRDLLEITDITLSQLLMATILAPQENQSDTLHELILKENRKIRNLNYIIRHPNALEMHTLRADLDSDTSQEILDLLKQLELQKLLEIHEAPDVLNLRNRLLTSDIAQKTLDILHFEDTSSIDTAKYVELLTILFGRVLCIGEGQAKDDKSLLLAVYTSETEEAELRRIVNVVETGFCEVTNDEVREMLLEITRHFPVITINEARMVMELAENTHDVDMEQACAAALRRSEPKSSEFQAVLKQAIDADALSNMAELRSAIEEQLKKYAEREKKSKNANKLVMVIDNSLTVRKILETSLKREGFEYVTYGDGIEMLRAMNENRHRAPDLLLLDIGLPKMDGYEVARHLKTREQFGNTIIVIISQRDGMIDRLKGRLAGARDYITKPFKTQEVMSIVHSYLDT